VNCGPIDAIRDEVRQVMALTWSTPGSESAPGRQRRDGGWCAGEQMIGKRFRNGVELSGVEWQKLAIARAYMRGAEVLILDEPTAALDARSEFEVFQRFKELSAGKTAVLISYQRPRSVTRAGFPSALRYDFLPSKQGGFDGGFDHTNGVVDA
jgi:ABC-type methionine transport system ATPase subunit